MCEFWHGTGPFHAPPERRAAPPSPSPSPADGLARSAAPLGARPELRVFLPGAVGQPPSRAGPQPCPVLPDSLRRRSSSFWRCNFAFWWVSYIWAMSDSRPGISYSQQTNVLRRWRPFAQRGILKVTGNAASSNRPRRYNSLPAACQAGTGSMISSPGAAEGLYSTRFRRPVYVTAEPGPGSCAARLLDWVCHLRCLSA